jgi:hypothetical protein
VTAALLVLHAAPRAWADRAAEAKAAYKLGKEHFKAGEYREALIQLQKAYKLKPHPSLLRYMGDTCYKMNQARQAIKYYRKYLEKAPMAADRDKVDAKVRQLELIVGAGEEDEEDDEQAGIAPPPPPPPPLPRTRRPARGGRVDMRPTGEDTENPLLAADRRRRAEASTRTRTRTRRRRDKPSGALKVMKWVTTSVGVAGLVTGITFMVLAKGKANDLQTAVKEDCPTSSPNCPGNPEMNNPVVPYALKHHELLQDYKLFNTVGIVGLSVGGALVATGVVLFIMDAKSGNKERRRSQLGPRVAVTPVFGGGLYGVAGEVRF